MRRKVNWGEVSLAQEASGLSIKEYCRKHRLEASYLYTYRSRSNRAERQSTIREKSGRFIPAVVGKEGKWIECQRGALTIRIPADLESVDLSRILIALGGAL